MALIATMLTSVASSDASFATLSVSGASDLGNIRISANTITTTTGGIDIIPKPGASITINDLNLSDLTASTYLTLDSSKNVVGISPPYSEKLIASVDASAAASIAFTGLSSTYNSYRLELSSMFPSTDGSFIYIRTSSDGVTYDSGASDYMWLIGSGKLNTTPSIGGAGDQADAQIKIAGVEGGAANEIASAVLHIIDHAAAFYTKIYGQGMTYSGDGSVNGCTFYGQRLSTTPVTAIEVFSGDNISATARLYGILSAT